MAAALLALASGLVYANTLQNGFVYDDRFFLLMDQSLRHWSMLPSQFLSVRPIKSLTLMIDYQLWGLNPMGYHLTNIILHGLCSVAFFYLVYYLSLSRRIAFLAAIFFALHPIHTEAVANINNRKDILAALFVMLALVLYVRKGRFLLGYGGTFVLYLLALLSKEVAAVAFLPLMFLYDLCLGSARRRGGLREAIGRFLPFLGVTVVAAGFMLWVAPGYMKLSRLYAVLYPEHWGIVARAFLKYSQLILFPYNLHADHFIPAPDSVFDLWMIGGISLLLLLVLAIMSSYRRLPLLFLGLAWMLLAWLPVSNMLPVLHYYVAERYFYLPSAGFCLALAVLLDRAYGAQSWTRLSSNAAVSGVVATVLVLLALGTYQRNLDWKSDLTLWSKTVKQSPSSPKAHINLGAAYFARGSFEMAVRHYEEAINLDPRSSKAYVNIASAYEKMGKYALSAEALGKVLVLTPQDHALRAFLGEVYWRQGLNDRAAAELREAIRIRPEYIPAYLRLGFVLATEKKWDEALLFYGKALDLAPENPKVHSYMGDLYQRMGRLDLALREFRLALELGPTARTHTDLAMAYMKVGAPDLAAIHLHKAITLDPDFALPHYLLAEVEGQASHGEKALEHYERFRALAGDRYPQLTKLDRRKWVPSTEEVWLGYVDENR